MSTVSVALAGAMGPPGPQGVAGPVGPTGPPTTGTGQSLVLALTTPMLAAAFPSFTVSPTYVPEPPTSGILSWSTDHVVFLVAGLYACRIRAWLDPIGGDLQAGSVITVNAESANTMLNNTVSLRPTGVVSLAPVVLGHTMAYLTSTTRLAANLTPVITVSGTLAGLETRTLSVQIEVQKVA